MHKQIVYYDTGVTPVICWVSRGNQTDSVSVASLSLGESTSMTITQRVGPQILGVSRATVSY